MALRFSKYEGLGNDFLIVEATPDALTAAQVVALCDRHRGVGGDGVLFTGGDGPTMRVVNADGSVPEMCGNGIRCVALHRIRSGHGSERDFDVATDAGPHHCRVLESGEHGLVEVTMRAASLKPGDLPVVVGAAVDSLIDAPFEIGGRTLSLTAVSMGNPHAVVFDDVGDDRLELGPALQADARFPQGVNVGFARQTDDGLVLDVLEGAAVSGIIERSCLRRALISLAGITPRLPVPSVSTTLSPSASTKPKCAAPLRVSINQGS